MAEQMREIGVGGLELTKEDKEMVNKVLDSNRLSYGPYVKQFESEFAKMHDSKFGIMTNSGTSSLHISVAALKERYGWKDQDEILVPAVTFIATSNVVLHNNMRPVFVDVEPNTFNIDPKLIEEKITESTRAIMPVHLLGLPADMDPIMQIAKKHNLRVIEDSAETMFARYKGRSVGSFGDVGCFSTYIAHYIITGVGGLNITSDPELAVQLRSLMNHGRDSIYISIDDDNAQTKEKMKEIISRRFSFVSLGHSFRVTEMEGALGLSQLGRKDQVVRRRKEIAARYLKGMADLTDRLQFQETPEDRDNVYMLFGMVCKGDDKRDLVQFLEENHIETRDLLPLLNQPVYKRIFGDIEGDYPVAKKINSAGLYIGCHQYITDDEVDYVIAKFHEFFKR
ncbi:MAG TPA: DegT/DnrJ/EryC1/StrS family aminotransferase [Candidatus Baltobacteraceae bacterium]|nr:DegT/DnrJ/EryC1/StrS family aminotransferase [Candidatus Baltobacteraceae bacterium]